MRNLRAVVDTNITVSGLLFGGLPLKIVKAGITRQFTWVISQPLMLELERVLSYKKFGLTQTEIKSATQPVFNAAEVIVPTSRFDVIDRCPGDNRVLECAVDGKCKVIATGDRRDLLSLEKFKSVEIITAKTFWQDYLSS